MGGAFFACQKKRETIGGGTAHVFEIARRQKAEARCVWAGEVLCSFCLAARPEKLSVVGSWLVKFLSMLRYGHECQTLGPLGLYGASCNSESLYSPH